MLCRQGRASGRAVGTIRQQIGFYREKREGEKVKSSYRKRGEKIIYLKYVVFVHN